ncbi:MAG TPA: hypothetical protein VGF94_03115 [Kofleriaceae bacterium]
MNKLLHSLGLVVAIATVGTLAGCDLYFGHDNGGNWSYCGSDGQYQCNGSDCSWVGPTCTDPGSGSGGPGSMGSGSGSGSGSGYECTSNTDCAAGCYCANGTCEEGGFCTTNGDCGPGYICDTTRSSCEPGCGADSDCPSGQYCDSGTSQCTASCTCSSDADAVAQGFGWCDAGTCAPGADPNGSCAGTVSCGTAQPTCPSGEVPTILNGCWTGNCEAIGSCDTAPSCAVINDEADCTARTDCQPVYTGIDCTDSSGKTCTSGDTGCTCATFQYNSCQALPR